MGVAVIVLGIVAPLVGGGDEPGAAPLPDPTVARVERVVDGDTVIARFLSGARVRVRLIGVDTPERGACFFAQATRALERLVDGREVRVELDDERRDRYDRLLAHLRLEGPDGPLVSERLLAGGDGRHLLVEPNDRHARAYAAAEARARGARRGLWGACPPAG